MSAKHRRITGAEMIAEEMARASLRSEKIPTAYNLAKSWKHADIHEHQSEDGESKMYIYEIHIPAAPSVVNVICTLRKQRSAKLDFWNWIPESCDVSFTKSNTPSWKFRCSIMNHEVVASPIKAS